MKMQDILASTEFPNGFDTWNVQERHDWMYRNITELFQNTPESLQHIIPAFIRPLDINRSQETLPEWMDMDKYRRGQKFVHDNYGSITISLLASTVYINTFDDVLKPVIISKKSHTPYLAFKRYLSTLTRILSWLTGEPWVKETKAYKDLKMTRQKHAHINTKMSKLSNEQFAVEAKIADPLSLERETFLKTFATECPFKKLGQRPYKTLNASSVTTDFVNNGTMFNVQGGIITLIIIYSQNIGIQDITDDDLEAYCHMWKCYGYLLGMEDEYNFCNGSLEQIKQRARDFSQYWVTVNFTDIASQWIHIMRCIAESINYYPLIWTSDKTMILFFTKALNVNMPNLYASLSYKDWIIYNFYNFLFHHALKFSIIRSIVNRLTHHILETASSYGPDKLAELREKSRKHLLEFSNKS
ncbi:PREDICTED: uncharacterized protein LOC106746620 isoform X2 [Dinoponera quadriceps]|uniref:Uncharacterized protein LOC106746620 isoform X2 n=1 Tax=Dinoponera quadriceps TaxID=609295 RepID=A0A6P3XK88_DINQU|nr:PREDICTED: uncharacterized protein LOC106746620 isoform X2 [Dinoponera quadriceps]